MTKATEETYHAPIYPSTITVKCSNGTDTSTDTMSQGETIYVSKGYKYYNTAGLWTITLTVPHATNVTHKTTITANGKNYTNSKYLGTGTGSYSIQIDPVTAGGWW